MPNRVTMKEHNKQRRDFGEALRNMAAAARGHRRWARAFFWALVITNSVWLLFVLWLVSAP